MGKNKEYREISSKEWKQKIQYELEGGDYQKECVFVRQEVEVAPFYNGEFFLGKSVCEVPKKCEVVRVEPFVDTICELSRRGNYPSEKHEQPKENMVVNVSFLADGGASAVEQVGYALAIVEEYLKRHERPRVLFLILGAGGYVFWESCKFYAIRMAIGRFLPNTEIRIVGDSSVRSGQDVLLRAWGVMGAVMGGADYVYADGEDVLGMVDYFSGWGIEKRGYFVNVAGQMASKGEKIYKEISRSGGYLGHLKTGNLQKKVWEKCMEEEREMGCEFVYENEKVGKTLFQPIGGRKMLGVVWNGGVEMSYGKRRGEDYDREWDWAGFEPYYRGYGVVFGLPKVVKDGQVSEYGFDIDPLGDVERIRQARAEAWEERGEKIFLRVEVSEKNIVNLPMIVSCGVDEILCQNDDIERVMRFVNPHSVDVMF